MRLTKRKMSILLVTAIVIISSGSACRRNSHRTPRPTRTPTTPVSESLRKLNLHKSYTLRATTTFPPFEAIMNWYRSTSEIHKNLVKLIKIGESVEKRKLMVMRVSPREKNDRPAVYIEATQHAREWLAPVTLNNIINKFINGYNEKREPFVSLFDKYIFYFESVANPDGYVYSFRNDGTRLWRKNRRRNRRCDGVDLNRNWDVDFGGAGGSMDSCSIVYQGPRAFSEPETRAMRDFMLNTIGVGNLSLYISMHSFSQLWVIPYSYTFAKPANYREMYRVANLSSYAIVTQTCRTRDCFYDLINGAKGFGRTSGGSDDWTLKNMRANYSYTLELPPSSLYEKSNKGFVPKKDVIPVVARQIEVGLLTMLKAMNP